MTDTDSSTRTTSHEPRATTWRTWAEIGVRPWLMLAVLLSAVVVAMVATQWSRVRQERMLVQNGIPVQAKVAQIGLARERQAPRDESQRVVLRYIDPRTGQTIESADMLPRKAGGLVSLDEVLTVRIDPEKPSKWTERTVPPSLMVEMLVPLLVVPVALICAAAALWQRQRVAAAVRNGTVQTGTVVSLKNSSIAPLSKHLSVTVNGPDRRVRHCYWPNKLGRVEKGSSIELIVAANGVVVPAKSYV